MTAPETSSDPTATLKALSRAGLFMALALVLPSVFHLLHLGPLFMPMVHPLLIAAFLLPYRHALAISVLTPLLSALVFGMPPLMPPIALWMAFEITTMGLSAVYLRRRAHVPLWGALAVGLLLGRLVYVAVSLATSVLLGLPSKALTLGSLFASFPGMLLALVLVPPVVLAVERKLGKTPQA